MKIFPARQGKKKQETAIYVFCALSLLFFAFARLIALKPLKIRADMLRASSLMKDATEAVKRCREAKGIPVDPGTDVNRTGLIGLEFSSITTSLGSLEAKRTTTNPNFAGLIVFLLDQAGVKRGDTIAIGASGSFPALIIAALSAAKTMDVRPLLICSLGASQWGANNPDFQWLDMQNCLLQAAVAAVQPVALSLGGEGDEGKDMSPEGRALLIEAAKRSHYYFLDEPDLEKNVWERLRLFGESGGENKVKAFVNIGGGYADMGTDSEILHVTPGLAAFRRLPPAQGRGVIFEMAARKIPVIHLLYIKGLGERYGLPWDPLPLPQPGEGAIYGRKAASRLPFLIIVGVYFSLVAVVLFLFSRDGDRPDALIGL
jgi:poly-gamma-glutamate system protein